MHRAALNISGKCVQLFLRFENERFKILRAQISTKEGKAGSVLDENLTIGCESASIKILELQREGKRPQKINEFILGSKIIKGSNL